MPSPVTPAWRLLLALALSSFGRALADATGVVVSSKMTLILADSTDLCTKEDLQTLSKVIASAATKLVSELTITKDEVTGLKLQNCDVMLNTLQTTTTTTQTITTATSSSTTSTVGRRLSHRRLAQQQLVTFGIVTPNMNQAAAAQSSLVAGDSGTPGFAEEIKKGFNDASTKEIQSVTAESFTIGCTVVYDATSATLPVPCAEGIYINDGSHCTVMCQSGYAPVSTTLQCAAAELAALPQCSPKACMPKEVANGEQDVCNELKGSSITELQHQDKCTPLCKPHYAPSVPEVQCLFGVLGTFSCEAAPCPTPQNLEHSNPAGACKEGASVASGSTCTPQCEAKYAPNVTAPSCSFGELQPFLCRFEDCAAPAGVDFAAVPSCREASIIKNGDFCTPMCAAGYKPTAQTMNCINGAFTIGDTFRCVPPTTTTPPRVRQRTEPQSPIINVAGSSSTSTTMPMQNTILAALVALSFGTVVLCFLVSKLMSARAVLDVKAQE